MPALVVLTLVLKVPIHAPKIGVLGDRFDPQNGEPYERDPKRHSSCAETRRHSRSTGASSARAEKIKQKIYILRNQQATCHVCTQTTYVVTAPHGATT